MRFPPKSTPDILAFPGIKHYFRGRDDEGNTVVIAIYEDQASAEATTETVKGMFARFEPYMASPPVPAGYDIYDSGSNT